MLYIFFHPNQNTDVWYCLSVEFSVFDSWLPYEQTVWLKSRKTFAISSKGTGAAKSLSILNRLIPLPTLNHTGFLHPLHSVCFNFCASRESTERPVAGRPRRLAFDDPSAKMSFSDAKTLLTLQKSNLYLQQETKIIKSEDRRADDPNSGAISTDCSTTSSHRI